ncbi:acyl-CoA carboxylase subunit epsilon [Georgenia faecalis]|uniref:acyl-CoA carboxylase subunit epsilon n=1 Tax=Georgenia faecalis TaxID=2483799 RepID=UPI001F49D2AC|nr:acyl-CoA carboxylase subunit epsilon [Georgenia faecalis]
MTEGWSGSGDGAVVADVLAAASAADGTTVRVVRGAPDDVELAALVAGIVAHRAAQVPPEELPPGTPWGDRARRLRAGLVPGPHTWRWSLHP